MVNDNEKENRYSNSVLNDISKWIDQHLYGIRYVSYGIGVLGLVILARTVRLTKKFVQVKDIPEQFITKHVRLQGKVEKVSPAGTLSIQHTPILTTRWSKPSQDTPLLVTLTAVDLLPPGIVWLQSHLHDQQVWFRLMSTTDNLSLSAIVTWKQRWYKRTVNINHHLIYEGLATYTFEEQLIDDKMYEKLSAMLCKAEIMAEKKGRGIWQRQTWIEQIKACPQKVKENIIGKKKEFMKSWKDWLIIKFRKKPSD